MLAGVLLIAMVGGVVGSPQPQAMTSMLPSMKILLAQARPEPGGGSLTVGEEFTGTAVKRGNLSPTARVLFPEKGTLKTPPRSTPAGASALTAGKSSPVFFVLMSVS